MYKDLSPVNNAKGFTLVEIIVVLSITALVFYTAMNKAVEKSFLIIHS